MSQAGNTSLRSPTRKGCSHDEISDTNTTMLFSFSPINVNIKKQAGKGIGEIAVRHATSKHGMYVLKQICIQPLCKLKLPLRNLKHLFISMLLLLFAFMFTEVKENKRHESAPHLCSSMPAWFLRICSVSFWCYYVSTCSTAKVAIRTSGSNTACNEAVVVHLL